ncbi:hypothetical protein HDU91_003770 [Kappamyces sp. JEL0680]|nr:hypothetical protein HDU91_003770 [Kappamyces sp. JEL0680]
MTMSPAPDSGRVFSLCGNDDSIEAKCALDKGESAAYNTSKAVLRIRKDGSAHCTGWLIGDQGHVITNNHCIGSASEAASLQFEAMAEGASCSTSCKSALACAGTFVHSKPLTFIATGGDTDQDWTLLQLPEENRATALSKYGFLRLRKAGSTVGEQIYVPGYPAGYGKRIALTDGSVPGTVISRDFDTGCGKSELIYKLDTLGGSSGSPVISHVDNLVVGIHHCGGCSEDGNSAVDVDKLYDGLKSLLPASTFV